MILTVTVFDGNDDANFKINVPNPLRMLETFAARLIYKAAVNIPHPSSCMPLSLTHYLYCSVLQEYPVEVEPPSGASSCVTRI